jgi:hypothetical protein
MRRIDEEKYKRVIAAHVNQSRKKHVGWNGNRIIPFFETHIAKIQKIMAIAGNSMKMPTAYM